MRTHLLPVLVLQATVACGCGSKPARQPLEDSIRSDAPVPACVLPLAARRNPVGNRSLKELQYWKLVFPSFDEGNRTLASGAAACTGLRLDADPELAGATSRRGAPMKVEEGDLQQGAGGDQMRVVWLRMFSLPNGREAGPLALVRAREDVAELYGVGTLAANPAKTRLAIERLGGRVVVTASDEGCSGRPVTTACESTLHVMVPVDGRLIEAVRVRSEQVAFATSLEPGNVGRLSVHLVSTPKFVKGELQVFEQVQVADDSGRTLRRAELQRTFRFDEGGAVVQSAPSLWERFLKSAGEPVK